jgi:hypothetical protein
MSQYVTFPSQSANGELPLLCAAPFPQLVPSLRESALPPTTTAFPPLPLSPISPTTTNRSYTIAHTTQVLHILTPIYYIPLLLAPIRDTTTTTIHPSFFF